MQCLQQLFKYLIQIEKRGQRIKALQDSKYKKVRSLHSNFETFVQRHPHDPDQEKAG